MSSNLARCVAMTPSNDNNVTELIGLLHKGILTWYDNLLTYYIPRIWSKTQAGVSFPICLWVWQKSSCVWWRIVCLLKYGCVASFVVFYTVVWPYISGQRCSNKMFTMFLLLATVVCALLLLFAVHISKSLQISFGFTRVRQLRSENKSAAS